MRKLYAKKAQTGMNILLGVIVMLFIIGILVLIFAVMSGHLEEQTWKDLAGTETNVTIDAIVNYTPSTINSTSITQHYVENCLYSSFECWNNTGAVFVPRSNYTVYESNCTIALNTTLNTEVNNSQWNCSFTWTAKGNTTASSIVVDASGELSGTTDWYGIIIIITVMVVLILLTVLIIRSIQGSGVVPSSRSSAISKETA